jgi:hypothetical protein
MGYQVKVKVDCREVTPVLALALESLGMRVHRTFDLRSALAALPDCGCPYHGTSQCTCQYAVLLVYGEAASPVEVVAHGRDGWTWVAVPQVNDSAILVWERVLAVLSNMFGVETKGRTASVPDLLLCH